MPERFGETLPPGWGALTVLPAPRRRHRWLGLLAAAVAVAGAAAWMAKPIIFR